MRVSYSGTIISNELKESNDLAKEIFQKCLDFCWLTGWKNEAFFVISK